MLDMKWRYVHLLFFFSFIGSWMAFAIIWKVAIWPIMFKVDISDCRYIIIYYHGDLEEDHLLYHQERTGEDQCEANTLTSLLLYCFSQAGHPVFGR